MRNRELSVGIEGDEIVMRIGLDVVAMATEMAPHMEGTKVSDKEEWARSVVAALDSETDDGSTPVTRMLDKAYYNAMDQGGEGIELIEEMEE